MLITTQEYKDQVAARLQQERAASDAAYYASLEKARAAMPPELLAGPIGSGPGVAGLGPTISSYRNPSQVMFTNPPQGFVPPTTVSSQSIAPQTASASSISNALMSLQQMFGQQNQPQLNPLYGQQNQGGYYISPSSPFLDRSRSGGWFNYGNQQAGTYDPLRPFGGGLPPLQTNQLGALSRLGY